MARANAAWSTPAPLSAVTHDRYFLDNVAGWIWSSTGERESLAGQLHLMARAETEPALAAEDNADHSRRDSLARELEWIRMAPKARHAKGKARISAYNELVAEAEAGRETCRQARDHHPARPRLGDRVVDADKGS